MDSATLVQDAAPVMGDQLEIPFPEAASRLEVRYVPRQAVHPDPAQPRKDADAELRASIAREGILQPLTVRPHPEILGEYMIIDGERRWRGAEGVQEGALPVIVREDKDDAFARLTVQLVANSGKPLTPMEEARAFQHLLDSRPDLTIAEVADAVGRPRSTVGDRLSLLQLGAWVPLLEAGKVPSSFATRFLAPLKSCADAVHAEAAAEFLKYEERDDLDAQEFEDYVRDHYRKALYPLTKIKTEQLNPSFDTRAHDAECDCGRVAFAFWGDKTRDCCGNPEWWKPRDRAARKAEKAKEPKTATSSRPRQTGPKYELPEGTKTVTSQHGETPKGATKLTGGTGMWSTSLHVWDDSCFDPTTVASDPKKLVLVKSAYSGSFIATMDTAAISAARKAWATKRDALLKEYRDELEKLVAKKTGAYAVQGKGTPWVLAAAFAREQIDAHDCCAIVGLKAPKLSGAHWNDIRTLESWAIGLAPKDAAAMLTVIAIVIGGKVQWPSERVEAELRKQMDRASRKAVPWVRAGAAVDDEDDGE